jgi:Glycosyl hydrolases family 43
VNIQKDPSRTVPTLTRRELLLGGVTLATSVALAFPGWSKAFASSERYRSFRPGDIWLDTAGKPIQAHGGSIIQVGEKYYWYGENKEFTTGKTDVWTWGVRCYSSSDLYNWDDLGLVIPPDTKDPESPLYPAAFLDRPHILYNQRTRQFVCWLKLMSKGMVQTRTVLVAEQITGPYRIVRQNIRPLGMSADDFDLVASPSDGKAYMYFERVHSELIFADLTDDYTDFTGYYSTHFPRSGPPLVREAPIHFFRQGKHYLVTSGTTGYFPNPSEVAVAETYHGPFTVQGDLHPTDRTRTSFNSQISCVFKHPKKRDLYIAIADRWMGPLDGTEFESGEFSEAVQRAFQKVFAPDPEPLTDTETLLLKDNLKINTSLSRYVWLPIHFDGERPTIEWRSEWSLDQYE